MTSDTAEPRARRGRVLALAIPAIGTLIADPLLGAVDTAVAGRLGSAELGAMGLAVGIVLAGTWVFNFLVFGTTTSVAHAIGRGDRVAAGRRVAQAAVVATVLGVVTGAVLFVAAAPIVRAFGAVDSLVDPAVTYLRVRAVGVPFLVLAFVGHGAFRGVGDTRTPLLVVVAANVLNGALDGILVFGFDMGLGGIAAATVAAEVAAVVLLALLIRRAGLPLGGHGLPDMDAVRALVVISRDLFLRTGGLLAGLLMITAAAARIDAATAADHQVLWQVFLLVSFMLDVFAIAGQSLVGTALGRGDREEARALARDMARWGAGVGLAAGLILVVLQDAVIGLFTPDPAVAAAAGSVWLLASLGHAGNGIAFALDGTLMGAADYRYLRTWTLVASAVGGVLAQVGVSQGGDLVWLWICVEVLMFLRAGSLLVRIRGTRWLTSDLAG